MGPDYTRMVNIPLNRLYLLQIGPNLSRTPEIDELTGLPRLINLFSGRQNEGTLPNKKH
jgi:hypothetical protein